VFTGIVLLIGILMLMRTQLILNRKSPPVVVRSFLDLSILTPVTHGVTPGFIVDLLGKESVINAIKNDLMKAGQIGSKELWRLGLLTPDQDIFDPRLYHLSRQERIKRSLEDPSFRFYILGKIPVKRTAVLHSTSYFNAQFNSLVITEGHSSKNYGLSTKMKTGDFTRIRDIQIERASAGDRSRFLPQFLQENGFPLKESYTDGDPLTTERGGTIVNDHGKIIVIYPKYFVQRRLVDDEGNLVYLGLDENFDHGTMFEVNMQPSVSRLLLHGISSNGYIPILRYRSFPYVSDFMLPILDTPISTSGWAELFIDTRGKAKLFIAKEKIEAEWYEMMNRLKQLLYSELARTDYHLLGLTKDAAHLNEYLAKKQEILADYYIIQDWELP